MATGVLEVRSIVAVAPGIVEIDLAVVTPTGLEVVPGQHLTVELSAGQRRSYSIASPPFAARPAYASEGVVVTPLVLAALPSLAAPTFYLCGNAAMVREVGEALRAAGVAPDRLRTDP